MVYNKVVILIGMIGAVMGWLSIAGMRKVTGVAIEYCHHSCINLYR